MVEVELIGGARGCGQTGFALRFMCIFLSGICTVLVRSVLKVFAKLFSKKLAARGTDKSKFENPGSMFESIFVYVAFEGITEAGC